MRGKVLETARAKNIAEAHVDEKQREAYLHLIILYSLIEKSNGGVRTEKLHEIATAMIPQYFP